MKNKSIEETATEEYDKILSDEIKELDNDISILNIEISENLRKKFSKASGLNLKRSKTKFNFARKIASVLSITIITAGIMSYMATQPKAVIAIKNIFRLLNVQNDESNAISFSLKEADNFNIELPQSFSKSLFRMRSYNFFYNINIKFYDFHILGNSINFP